MVLTIGGILLYEKPFKPLRPPETDLTALESAADSRVDTPQWEDPFKFVAQDFRDRGGAGPIHGACEPDDWHLASLRGELRSRLDADPDMRFRVHLVVTASGFTHNDIEIRRRQRMALAQAMVQSRFAPEAAGQLNYLTFPAIRRQGAGEGEAVRLVPSEDETVLMPFEWFRGAAPWRQDGTVLDDPVPQSHLVLWLRAADVLAQPSIALRSLEIVVSSIIPPELQDRTGVVMIGPQNSAQLQTLLEIAAARGSVDDESSQRVAAVVADKRFIQQVQQVQQVQAAPPRPGSPIEAPLFPWAEQFCAEELAAGDEGERGGDDTGAVANVPPTGQGAGAGDRDSITVDRWTLLSPRATVPFDELEQLSGMRGNLHRMIADDARVTGALVDELVARNVDTCAADTRIDLVLEGSSVYGTSYRETFARALSAVCGKPTRADLREHFFYNHTEGEREAPRRASDSQSGTFAGIQVPELHSGSDLELPTGPHQLDYIRRMAKFVATEGQSISAIGIIGADVYDKQLIIEAIRTYLPGTLIFTTDADALYEHPSFYGSNQNLLIASAWGLTVPVDLPYRVVEHAHEGLGFRDNYQTAFHVSVLKALSDPQGPPGVLPVKLFEVGRSGLIDITAQDSGKNRGQRLQAIMSSGRLVIIAVLMAPLLALQWFLWTQRKGVTGSSESQKSRHEYLTLLLVLGGVAIVLSGLGVVRWALQDGLEPFYLFEGISAAPTIMFRVSAGFYALCLIVFIHAQMHGNLIDLADYFKLRDGSQGDGVTAAGKGGRDRHDSIGAWQTELTRLVSRSARAGGIAGRLPTAPEVWARYVRLDRFRNRLRRVLLPLVVIMAVICWVAYIVYSQPHLVRVDTFFRIGPINGFQVITLGSIALSTCAVLMAGDAMRLSTLLIRWHEYDFVVWPHYPSRSIYKRLYEYPANRLASVELIMRRTEVMRQVIILPFVVLFLQVVARSNLFEGWTWNPGIVSIYAAFAIYLFFCGARLQQAANQARRRIIVDLERHASNLQLGDAGLAAEIGELNTGEDSPLMDGASKERRAEADRFRKRLLQDMALQRSMLKNDLLGTNEVISYTSELKRGLFRPLLDHPLFQAIAWPSTGLGLLALMQLVLTN